MWQGLCMARGMHGRRSMTGRGGMCRGGACMAGVVTCVVRVWQGGMHGGGCAWQVGMCGGHVWQGL